NTLPSAFGRKTAAEGGAVLLSDLALLASAVSKLAVYAGHRAKLAPEITVQASPLSLQAGTPSLLSEHRVKSLFAPYRVRDRQRTARDFGERCGGGRIRTRRPGGAEDPVGGRDAQDRGRRGQIAPERRPGGVCGL